LFKSSASFEVEHDLALGQLIYDLRTAAGLSQRELAERMGTTQSVISRLEERGGARNRIDTLARVATALERHLVVSFPEKVPASSRTQCRSPDPGALVKHLIKRTTTDRPGCSRMDQDAAVR
jgi:transcriptional regulator with XRE-family HTH domain